MGNFNEDPKLIGEYTNDLIAMTNVNEHIENEIVKSNKNLVEQFLSCML